jgi:hypothetical protein
MWVNIYWTTFLKDYHIIGREALLTQIIQRAVLVGAQVVIRARQAKGQGPGEV